MTLPHIEWSLARHDAPDGSSVFKTIAVVGTPTEDTPGACTCYEVCTTYTREFMRECTEDVLILHHQWRVQCIMLEVTRENH